ncbi:MAG: hypothetical protein H6861_02790 [Rhodospirillales bacterium]|nr:hypothetical protein [Rhodospirillales bacterium]
MRFGLWVICMLFAGLTASCGPLTDSSKSQPSASSALSSENLIGENTQSQPSSTSALEVPPPVAVPPSYGDRPPQPGQMQSSTMPNGLPALQPKGVNVDGLFADKISDTDQRFTRLENAVLDLRREFETFKPAITRLVAVESDIQDLIKQLDMLLSSEPAAPPTPLASPQAPPQALRPTDQAPAPQVAAPPSAPYPAAPQAMSGDAAVKTLRVGQHSDKVRLVLDISKKTPYTADLDAQEKLLIVELPEAGWNAPMSQSFSSSALLQSYSVEPINNGAGSRVVMTLKRPTQLIKQQALPPGNGNPNYRIFLDLSL